MSPPHSPHTLERFAQGYTYQEYLARIQNNREQFEANYREFQLSPEDASFFQELNRVRGPVRVLALAEDWCPDVYRGLPVMARIAEAAGLELRIFPRDQNLDLMNLYLKDGQFMSIPTFAFFDGSFAPLGHWIERPAAAYQWMDQVRRELASLPQEAYREEMRRRRAAVWDSWRQETVRELRELLAPALRHGGDTA